MQSLTHQRCFNHGTREAVARCPECRQFFCRECVVEHDDRLVCVVCLKTLTTRPLLRQSMFAWIRRTAQLALGILIAWFFFFLIGEGLLKLPDSFHEGTLWQVNTPNQE
ncbi:MAG TPA: rhomboid family protein [Verrucomicrobiae bacterium]|jgi:hypothetical protein